MLKSDNIDELATALSKVQAKLAGAKMDGSNPFFKSKYATLLSVWEASRKPLTDNGLSVVQTCSVGESEGLIVDTTLLHSSGQWISGELAIKPTKNDPQGVGSAITYARRYGLAAIIGICPEDDDAESAMERKPAAKVPDSKTTPAQLKKIYAVAKEKGYSEELAASIMVRDFGTGHSKELTKKQASDFIEILTEGKYLEEATQETQVELTPKQDDGEAPKTAGDFLNWIMKRDPNIKAPRVWLQAEYGVTDKEILTAERIKELYDKIKE